MASTRAWLGVAGTTLVIGGLLVLQTMRAKFTTEHQTWLEHLARAKAERATAERMAAELERAIAEGRVHFGGEVVERETRH